MPIRIKPQLEKTWASTSIRRYGVDNPLELAGLTEPEHALLQALEIGFASDQLAAVASLCGVSLEDSNKLLNRLQPVLSSVAKASNVTLSKALRIRQPNDEILQNRATATIYVPQLDRLGRLVVLGLAESGIGRVICGDNSLVKQADCAAAGYPETAIGTQRLTQLRAELPKGFRLGLDYRLQYLDYQVVDAALVVSDLVHDPASYQRWLGLDIDHLAICFSDDSVTITAAIIAGITPCLSCRSIESSAEDSYFATVAPQYLHSKNDYRDYSATLMSAAIAIERLLELVDGQASSTLDLKFDYRNSSFIQQQPKFSNCGCRITNLETVTEQLNLERS